MKKIVRIEPHYEPRIWGGGTRLRDEFGYRTDVAPLGEVYNVVALKNHADCAVRLYDYDRIDPSTGTTRPIQPEAVFENVNLPDKLIEFQYFPAAEEFGCRVTRYWDEPGLYTLMRIQTDGEGHFLHERFAFYTCVKGEGTINDIPVRQGDTVLVPAGTGWIHLRGALDLFLASYRNQNYPGRK